MLKIADFYHPERHKIKENISYIKAEMPYDPFAEYSP